MLSNPEIHMLKNQKISRKKVILSSLLLILSIFVVYEMFFKNDNETPISVPVETPKSVLFQIDKNNLITVDLEHVNSNEALQAFAKQTKQNIIISANVSGEISLHLEHANQKEVLQALLATQNLFVWRDAQIIFIGTKEEIAEKEEQQRKLREEKEQQQELQTQSFPIHYANAKELLKVLQASNRELLSARGQMIVDERTNQISITDTPHKIIFIKKLIHQFDVPLKQVLIEAHLASVDCDFERELGVHFEVQSDNPFTLGNQPNPNHFSIAVAALADGTNLNIALAAMENEGRGELISSPSLFTMNQQTASIESGEEIPYQEVSLSGGTGIAFKKAVLSLKVTPQILPGGKILLELRVNQDRPSSRIVQGVPAISTRQITTHVLIDNEQTVVLGGIFELNNEHNEQRIPFLGKIPLLGILFSDHTTRRNKRELLIFVRPKILSA